MEGILHGILVGIFLSRLMAKLLNTEKYWYLRVSKASSCGQRRGLKQKVLFLNEGYILVPSPPKRLDPESLALVFPFSVSSRPST